MYDFSNMWFAFKYSSFIYDVKTLPIIIGDHQCLCEKDLLIPTLHILNLLPEVRAICSVQDLFLKSYLQGMSQKIMAAFTQSVLLNLSTR